MSYYEYVLDGSSQRPYKAIQETRERKEVRKFSPGGCHYIKKEKTI